MVDRIRVPGLNNTVISREVALQRIDELTRQELMDAFAGERDERLFADTVFCSFILYDGSLVISDTVRPRCNPEPYTPHVSFTHVNVINFIAKAPIWLLDEDEEWEFWSHILARWDQHARICSACPTLRYPDDVNLEDVDEWLILRDIDYRTRKKDVVAEMLSQRANFDRLKTFAKEDINELYDHWDILREEARQERAKKKAHKKATTGVSNPHR